MKKIGDEFKTILKPYYRSQKITKDEYKEIMRKAVPRVFYYLQNHLQLTESVRANSLSVTSMVHFKGGCIPCR